MLVSIYVTNFIYKKTVITELQEGLLIDRRINDIFEIDYSDIFFNTFLSTEEIELLNKDIYLIRYHQLVYCF